MQLPIAATPTTRAAFPTKTVRARQEEDRFAHVYTGGPHLAARIGSNQATSVVDSLDVEYEWPGAGVTIDDHYVRFGLGRRELERGVRVRIRNR